MLRLAAGAFLVLHGFVHVWYVALSRGWVTVDDQMGWNGHSWLLSGALSTETVLAVASVLYVLAGVGFAVGAAGYVARADWAAAVLVAAAVVSAVTLVAMWDGRLELLVEKGVVGVAIDAAVVALLALR